MSLTCLVPKPHTMVSGAAPSKRDGRISSSSSPRYNKHPHGHIDTPGPSQSAGEQHKEIATLSQLALQHAGAVDLPLPVGVQKMKLLAITKPRRIVVA